jgi:hypothetical protein
MKLTGENRAENRNVPYPIVLAILVILSLSAHLELATEANAADLSKFRLTFNDTNLTNCYYRNQFFNKSVRSIFALFDALGTNQIDPPPGNPFYQIGRFAIYGATQADPKNGISTGHTGPGIVKINCDNAIFQIPVDSSLLPTIGLKLANSPPISTGIRATLSGVLVKGVPPGSTVRLTVNASDANGDPLTYAWLANGGVIGNTGKAATGWRLPLSSGIHFAYVLIGDGKGGFREDSIAISTDGGVVTASPPQLPVAQPSDLIRTSDHFLNVYSTFYSYDKGADSRLGSCLYYKAIGAVSDCASNGAMIGQLIDFATWKAKWGFSISNVRAVYANVVDLNLQRDMHGTTNSNGTAFFVCNSPNTSDFADMSGAILHKGVVACVAMEYSAPVGGGSPFTKFIVFGQDGRLLQSVNLDGNGEKYVPGSCVACHGSGNSVNGKGRIDETLPVNPDLAAHFLPFDLDNFAFSSNVKFNRVVEEPKLKALNQMILATNPTPAISELINGWYSNTGIFDGTFVPSGWAGDPDFYRGVIKPACRMCHVANIFPFPTFNTRAEAQTFAAEMAGLVCGNMKFAFEKDKYAMPNAQTTFNRFWNDIGGIGGDTQAQRMLSFINANVSPTISACKPPAY